MIVLFHVDRGSNWGFGYLLVVFVVKKVVAVAAAGGDGNELKVGWQLSGGLSAPDLPLTLLPIAVVAVVAVVNQGPMRVLLLLLSLSTLVATVCLILGECQVLPFYNVCNIIPTFSFDFCSRIA
ncbi:hypothetical protein GQX74_004926 [Glossina fuscipes]|nr:hypothetical protein GQX74_004926 [Glossina fuscipes]